MLGVFLVLQLCLYFGIVFLFNLKSDIITEWIMYRCKWVLCTVASVRTVVHLCPWRTDSRTPADTKIRGCLGPLPDMVGSVETGLRVRRADCTATNTHKDTQSISITLKASLCWFLVMSTGGNHCAVCLLLKENNLFTKTYFYFVCMEIKYIWYLSW